MRRLFVAAALLAGVSCKCGGPTQRLQPQLEVLEDMSAAERTSVDFGFVQVNIKGVQQVRVRNAGTAVLQISEAAFTSTQFGTDTPLPFEVAPGDEGKLALTFTPTAPDQRVTGTVTLTSNDPMRQSYVLQLAGQGVTAVARVSPTTINFMDVYVGETKTVMLTLTNAGGNALPVRGASITGSPNGVSGNFASFTGVMIAPGASATVPVTFAPMAGAPVGPITGAVVIDIEASSGGSVTVPITGRATQALPRMCFKFDDEAMERCTDQISHSLTVPFGALCDNRIYATGPNACTAQNGQRKGKLYFRNEGNIPIAYSARYQPYLYSGSRCGDGGVAQSDFIFDNVPVPDGGVPMDLTTNTMNLPMNEMVARPWESMPIGITYRASSGCRDEAADQARILWTRQDPATTMPIRAPGTLLATLTGTSILPSAKPKTVNIGQAGQPTDVPLGMPIPVELVTNEGLAPLTLNSVELWEELPAYLPDGGTYDGGGPEGGLLSMCNPASTTYEFSDCARFQWAPGQSPAQLLPVTLDGGRMPGNPSQATVGRLFIGCLNDGGSCPPNATRYKVIAIVNTSDPYAPRVAVPIITWVRFLP